jgi:hypothetical protein
LAELQFPHASVQIVDKEGRWTREGYRFAFGLWTRTGSGATPAVNAAVSGTAGAAYTATEQQLINDLVSLVNQMRQTLVDNGLVQ